MTRFDLLVIGGGLVGYACAWRAQRRGLSVCIVDDVRAGRASRAAAGMLAPYSELQHMDTRLAALGAESLRRTPEFLAELEHDSGQLLTRQRGGTLWVALHRDHEAQLEHLASLHREAGVPGTQLSAEQTRSLEPSLSPRTLSGYHLNQELALDPRSMHGALRAALLRLGGREANAGAQELVREGDRVAGARTEKETFLATTTLVANGAWASPLLTDAIDDQVRPIKGQTLLLQGRALISRIVRTPEAYLVPRGDALVLGASTEEVGFDASVRAGAVHELLREGMRVLPELSELALIEVTTGFRPALRSALPHIGATRVPGLHCAVGHHRHGVLLLAYTAHRYEQVILNGLLLNAQEPM